MEDPLIFTYNNSKALKIAKLVEKKFMKQNLIAEVRV